MEKDLIFVVKKKRRSLVIDTMLCRMIQIILSIIIICMLCVGIDAHAATVSYKKKQILVGESFRLTVKSKNTVTYTSDNKKICKVSKNGKVTGMRQGMTTIRIKVGKKTYKCKVTVNKYVDLILFVGQSNMTGQGGNAALAPKLTDGAGYECKTMGTNVTLEPLKEPFGYGEDSLLLNDSGYHNGTLVTAFANSYFKETGVPVICVAATRGGSNSGQWVSSYGDEAIQRYTKAYRFIKKNKLKVRNSYLVYYQGESEAIYASAGFTPDYYKINVDNFVKKVMEKTKVSNCLLIPIVNSLKKVVEYDAIRIAQEQLCEGNDNIIMITEKTPVLTSRYYISDGIHINQIGLNLIGKDAGTNAGRLAGRGR